MSNRVGPVPENLDHEFARTTVQSRRSYLVRTMYHVGVHGKLRTLRAFPRLPEAKLMEKV